MSESQYYEFLAVDRPLTERQIGELRSLSSRAHITPTSFVNEYNWGNFRGSPRRLMETHFDAFLYHANWGTRRLMLRVPRSLLDLSTARQYCVSEAASAWATGNHVILDLTSEDETGERWDDDDWGAVSGLASLIPVRADLMTGDLRLLYLAWLLCVTLEYVDDFAPEPPVPPGLGRLTGTLRALVGFLRIDPELVEAAAAASAPLPPQRYQEDDLARWIAALPVREKDALLLRVAGDGGAPVRAELIRRFRASTGTAPAATAPRRTAGELWQAALDRRAARERSATHRRNTPSAPPLG